MAYEKDDRSKVYALKEIDKRSQGITRTMIDREKKLRIQSNHIVNIFETKECKDYAYLLMEPANCGDLFSLCQHRGGYLKEQEAREMLRQLVCGLKDLHDADVVHRDIKPENVLITSESLDNAFMVNKAMCETPEFKIEEYLRTV
jgi:serine/threonine protein kinase